MGASGAWVAWMDRSSPKPEIRILADPQALAVFAASLFIQIAQVSIAQRGRFRLALAGGSTPRVLFQYLSQPTSILQIEWSAVQVYWGDERCVPPDQPDSNYLMAQQALLDHVPVPDGNIHRIFGELEPEIAASRYEDKLKKAFLGAKIPRFDLILLGLGDDGHTASLFPGSPALQETDRWVVSVEHHNPPLPLVARISLTLPVLNAAANVLFMVSGAAKAGILREVLLDDRRSNPLPAQLIDPSNGRLVWAVDRAAAGEYLDHANLA